jgi:general nucleoside transport system ATP-binding protein
LSRLALRAIHKRFGAVPALAPLTLDLPAGSIHGLLGENGAGKSTLVRVVAGILRQDGGAVLIDGQPLAAGDPLAARRAGVGVVHQHFALIGALSVAENLVLGRPEAAHRFVRPAALRDEALALAAEHGLDVGDPLAPCRTLPVGIQARIEILRALSGRPRVLLLDEPTAVLTPPETADLFASLRRLRDAGMLVVFITHKLAEAVELCDRISVLRAGHLVTTLPAAAASMQHLAALMVGDAGAARTEPGEAGVPRAAAAPPRANARSAHRLDGEEEEIGPLLTVEGLSTLPAPGRPALEAVSFDVRAGEICGIAGVDGNGQDELAEALVGAGERAGDVAVGGVRLPAGDVAAAQQAGVAVIPADRQRDGLALGLSVWENVLLAAPLLARFSRRGLVDRAGARGFAARLARDYRVVLASVDQPIRALSGGNQQRIVVGRALAARPTVLLALNPTRGLDVAATTHVHATLRRVAAAGAAVVLVSTDLDEVTALASRVYVFYRGRLAGPVAPNERERVGRLMAGVAR